MIHGFRVFLYVLLFIFSAVVMSLCAVRLHYTLNLSPFDPLNYGISFYDPIIIELLVTSILSMLWALLIGRTIHRRIERRLINTFAAELIGLFVLFLLWIVGAAIATRTGNPPDPDTHWGNLSSCWNYASCRVLTAMLAFAWVSWVVVLALFITSFLFASANKAFRDPLHGRWDRRATHYGTTLMRNLP
ncbi:hypothetical protein EDC04DRAFT_2586753 [Pisolithus marmoratus]|nr:hypothetical protein EDC04DRAFT_2586753 [Pisolithus marmoratus]